METRPLKIMDNEDQLTKTQVINLKNKKMIGMDSPSVVGGNKNNQNASFKYLANNVKDKSTFPNTNQQITVRKDFKAINPSVKSPTNMSKMYKNPR